MTGRRFLSIAVLCAVIQLPNFSFLLKILIKLFLIYLFHKCSVQFSSVAQSCLTLCDAMNLSMPGLPPSPAPGVYSNSCPSSRWCHPATSSSVVPFSSCPQRQGLFQWVGQRNYEYMGIEVPSTFIWDTFYIIDVNMLKLSF